MNAEISNTKDRFILSHPHKYFLPIILLFAVFVRIFFFTGFIFSDDSYYNWLSFQLSAGSYNLNFLGYPIFLIRKFSTLFTSFSYTFLGYNEIATISFPFIFSILSVFLVYKISEELTKQKKISLIASFLAAFFPVDIIFATINFSDLECVFFINLGIYFYIKALRSKNNFNYIIAGICLSASILFKEYAYYYYLLLVGNLVYHLFVKKIITYQSTLPLIIGSIFLILEGIYYLITQNNYLYRLQIFQANYIYCYYDFFPYTLAKDKIDIYSYLKALLTHIGNNLKYISIRRYYLFLPVFSVIQSYILFKKREQKILLVWFLGLILLLPLMTVSFSNYSPIELRRIWYIYPLIFPLCILTALLLARLKSVYLTIALFIYLAASMVMSSELQSFFDLNNKNRFKQFLKANSEKVIYTDHHTAYGIRFINGFKKNKNVKLFTNEESFRVKKGELIIYSDEVISELQKQKYSFPNFSIIRQDNFKLISSIGQFKIIERIK